MTPPPKDLLTTSEREAIADEVERRERQRERTQGPVVSGESASRMYEIAERVVERSEPAHILECENNGPVCRVREEMKTMASEIKTVREEQTKLLAVLGFWKWALPVVAAAVGAFASLVGALWKAGHGG